jgi:hypothetical protein
MKTICDTNIWRALTEEEIGESDLLKVESPLTLSFINIDEIIKSNMILSAFDKAKNVIQSMMKMPAKTIYEPPLIYLKKMDVDEYEYIFTDNNRDILYLAQAIANGQQVIESKFLAYKENRNQIFKNLTDEINKKTQVIRSTGNRPTDLNTENINRKFISFLVKSQTGIPLTEKFDWTQIELFENVLSMFFKELETTKTKIKPNDIYDLFILIYVQPKDKFWSKDLRKGPLKYVKNIAAGKYIFE